MSDSRSSNQFLGSRVGRRLVLLFVLCALLPLLSLAGLSHRAVRNYLLRSGVEDLRSGSKAYAMSLVDRLDVLEAALRDAAVTLGDHQLPEARGQALSRRFSQVGVVAADGTYRPVWGPRNPAIRLTEGERERTKAGRVVVVGGSAPLMVVAAPPQGDGVEMLAGRIDGDFLWWGVTRENSMPASTTVAVVVDGSPVFSTVRQADELAAALAAGTRKNDDRASGLRWRADGDVEVASYWKVPLSVRFGSGDWTVVWSRPESAFLAPVERFERLFALVLSATLLATLAVAAWQIRRFLVPLDRLREGTRRIASHDFATPVEVSTDDEFGDLAGSFNEMARQLDELVEDLRRHQLGTLRALARAIDERSPWTLGHSGRVARLVNQLAQRLGVSSADRWDLHRAALLHDIGKLSIESDLLDQPGHLTPEQRSLIEQHVGAGVRILEPVPGYERIRPIVAQHHERLDGSGYPLGLRGEQIGLGARVLAVADSFDALSSDRPYRAGLPIGEVVEELRRGAGSLYDPRVLEALEDLLADGLPDDSWLGDPRRAVTARAPSAVAEESARLGGTNPARST